MNYTIIYTKRLEAILVSYYNQIGQYLTSVL